ncbi:MAG TPA: AmmeMemoRadiSam system protein B [Thermoanaerobaculia bacterium]
MRVRQPAVAGSFYDADSERLARDVRRYVPEGLPRVTAIGAIVPHAGYVYSGPVAGAVYGRLELPSVAVVLCPNHTGHGVGAALDPSAIWRTPVGDVPLARRLADRILDAAPSLEPDEGAHRREHSLEVQLPFLRLLRPDIAIVPICLGVISLPLCREVGEAIARVVRDEEERPILLASSDMNHQESRKIGRPKDDLALARIEALDAEGLFRTVFAESITMCGVLPATALLFAAQALGATRAEVVSRRDSGDETGDVSSVVGYAGVVIT